MKCEPSVFSTKPDKKQEKLWVEDVKECMRTLDSMLIKNKLSYLSGEKISLADIVIYNELSMFMHL